MIVLYSVLPALLACKPYYHTSTTVNVKYVDYSLLYSRVSRQLRSKCSSSSSSKSSTSIIFTSMCMCVCA